MPPDRQPENQAEADDQDAPEHQGNGAQGDQLAEYGGETPEQDAEVDQEIGVSMDRPGGNREE